eukprot:1881538-Rhodomonas_salina.2
MVQRCALLGAEGDEKGLIWRRACRKRARSGTVGLESSKSTAWCGCRERARVPAQVSEKSAETCSQCTRCAHCARERGARGAGGIGAVDSIRTACRQTIDTPKLDTRNRSPGTNWTEIAVSCV